MKKKSTVVFTLFMMLMLALSLSVSASAAQYEYKAFTSDSTFKPVSYSTHKSVSSVTLYGNADYLCMKSVKDTSESQEFRLEIYSDSKRKKLVSEFSSDYKKGTKYNDIIIDLTGLKSKTYYATSYVIKRKNDVYSSYQKDPDTVTKFKIVVKKDGTSLKKMKTVMYGYENSPSGPVVYWYSVPGATKYEVYKKKDGKFKKIKTVKAKGGDFSYYTDTSLKDKNATAVYKVKAVNGTGKTPLSEDELKVNAVKTPKVTVKPYSKGGFRLTWSKVSSDATYYVYGATANSDWCYLAETKSRSYVVDDNEMINGSYLKSGTAYWFTVIAVNSKGTSGYEDNKSQVYLVNPEVKSLKEVSGNLVVSWDKVKSADSYNVYRRQSADDEWTKIGYTGGTSFTDYDAARNTLYMYCVRSVRDSAECVNRDWSKTGAMLDVPVIDEIKADGAGNPVITWNKTEGVSYCVRRRAEGESSWTTVGTTKNNRYTDKNNSVNGQKYLYAVNVYVGYMNGDYSKEEAFNWYLPIKNAVPSPADEGIGLNWEAVKNAEGYNLYRKTADSSYSLIGSTETNYFNDKTAVTGVAYTYKIVCVAEGAEKSITAAELPARIGTGSVKALKDTAEADEALFCSVKIADYDSSCKYTLYTKLNGVWTAAREQTVSEDGTVRFRKNYGPYVNEYALSSLSADGTVTSVSDENIFTVEYILPPEISSKASIDESNVTVSWKRVEGAEKYNIYLDGEKIATVDGTKTSYKSGKLKAGPNEYYYFSVGAVRGKTEFVSDTNMVNVPVRATVKAQNDEKSILVSWNDATYHGEYIVYRKTSANGEWKVIGQTAKEKYTDKNVENGKTYYYKVLTTEGIMSKNEAKITFIKPVTLSTPTLGKNYVQIKWKKSSQADYYMVYKKKDGKWKKVYTTESNKTVKYTDKDVKTGKKYYYRIYAVKNGSKSEYTSESVRFVTAPKGLKTTAVSGGVKLTFGKVSGAKKYVIYRKSGDGKYKKIKTLKSSVRTYTDKSVKKGVKYTYYVKTYNGSEYSVASSKVTYKKK